MTEPSRIRVIVVDDHSVIRGGLRLFLLAFDDMELVGEASGGEEAVRLCDQLHPDVVLMDLVMPGMNGVEATHAIRERYPQVQVIADKDHPTLQHADRSRAVRTDFQSAGKSKLRVGIGAATRAADQ